MSHLTLVDQSNSELEAYLRKVLKNTGVDVSSINAAAAAGNDKMNGGSPEGRASNGVALRNARMQDVREISHYTMNSRGGAAGLTVVITCL